MTPSSYQGIKDPHTGKLLFLFDPARRLIQIQRRRTLVTIDLTQYENTGDPPLDKTEGRNILKIVE